MNQSTARMSLGALLGTVTTAANAVSSTIGTIGAVVGMADTYIGQQVKQQQTTMILESADFEDKLIERVAMETTVRKLELAKFTAQSPAHAQLFDASTAELKAHLAKVRGTTQPTT